VDARFVSGERVRYKHIIFDNARWDGFELRPDDIVISTAPKCGTTWVQMICALLIFQTPELPDRLGKLSPFLDMLTRSREDVVADLDAQAHRRFIKTHTPLDGLPIASGVTYVTVGRDPRDVFVSGDNHRANTDFVKMFIARRDAVGLDDIADQLSGGPPERLPEQVDRFWFWVDSDAPVSEGHNLRNTIGHVASFWDARDDPGIVLMHYDDLRRDLEREMRRLATRLDITVPEDRWPDLVAAASFEHMRDNADRLAAESNLDFLRDNARFFRRGTSGQWRHFLDAAGEARYWKRAHAVASPEVVRWMHEGSLSTR
jgi:hypothetical protein